MTSVPEITRLLAKIQEWQDGSGQPRGRVEAACRLDEAHKLLDEINNIAGRAAADVARRQTAVITPRLPP